MKSREFIAVSGRSGNAQCWTAECPIPFLLSFSERANYDAKLGISDENTGVNRAWDQKRSGLIAAGLEKRLASRQPMEFGAVILLDSDKKIKVSKIGECKRDGMSCDVIEIPDGASLALVDRQHTVGAFEEATANPHDYPLLFGYLQNPIHTVTTKIVQDTIPNGRKRFEHLNYKAKALTPIEKLIFATFNALDSEKTGELGEHNDILPEIVCFMAWHQLARTPGSIWYDRLTVDSMITSRPPVKQACAVKWLVDETVVLYRFYMENAPGFDRLDICGRANIIQQALTVFWNALAERLPGATGDGWFNYLFLKRGARLIVKVHAGLVRAFLDRREKKGGAEERWLKEMSFTEFCESGIVDKFIARLYDNAPWSDEYWLASGNGFSPQKGDEKEAAALQYMWRTFRIYKWNGWDEYCDSIRTNPGQNRRKDQSRTREAQSLRAKRQPAVELALA